MGMIEVKQKSKEILKELSHNLSLNTFKSLLENLEEGFYNGIISLPRKFNGIDEKEQLAALNLVIGYINVLGEHKLEHVLLSAKHLETLMFTLIHVSDLEKSNISLLEEYKVHDLETMSNLRTPWKNFRHFKEDSVRDKLEKLCALLARSGALEIVSDFLLNTIIYHAEHRKEAIFILNETITGINAPDESMSVIGNILNTYIDSSYWYVPLSVSVDDFGYANILADVQNNVIQVCLLVEGLGKLASVLQNNFRQFFLKTLFLVLERAGSSHPLVKAAGLSALKNITGACGYPSITDLINDNIDFFSYHVERKLNRIQDNESVLEVLTVVLKYSTVNVLHHIAGIIKEVLIQSCDKFKEKNATAFLRVFEIFIHCLRKWYSIEVKVEPFKSKADKLDEVEQFEVTGLKMEEEPDFSDIIMGKTAEEMYKEDMEKQQSELEKETEQPEVEEYKKPDPPLHIKLTVAVLSRTLHFLPSKDKTRKLLALTILNYGIEIIRDWEDELLPIVHQIWSPLVPRFKEFDNPLTINYSFQLLVTLARLSKDFIRMRTTKEVMPSILQVLNMLSQESYLKDKGSAYRYSQGYKLQLTILENLATVLINLDIQEEKLCETMDSLFKYLCNKQPVPLQLSSIEFFKSLMAYDPKSVEMKLETWQKENVNNEYEKNIKQLCTLLTK
ncbi:hypothetical protein NQ318_003088 [Aromia moschata]|uniref:TTI1 C-terminal TPR domain-containing protein n=1 Tax=Aromia moschata TaxID=1265417 RepID=A0AAV8XT13_9CUCU|nr:hypothetical protein NQ318_003088 [Aromia moschata]